MALRLLVLLACAHARVHVVALTPDSQRRPWMTTHCHSPPADRAGLVLAKMTQAEKLAMLHGNAVGGTECFNKTTGKIIGAYCACTLLCPPLP
jgi:hypothetical protein